MSTSTVRTVLRIVAVVTVLVGWIGVSIGVIGLWGMNKVMQTAIPGGELSFSMTSMSGYAILSWLVVPTWGFLLYAASPMLARHITSDPDRSSADETVPLRDEAAHI
jgi:hypothetical protein